MRTYNHISVKNGDIFNYVQIQREGVNYIYNGKDRGYIGAIFGNKYIAIKPEAERCVLEVSIETPFTFTKRFRVKNCKAKRLVKKLIGMVKKARNRTGKIDSVFYNEAGIIRLDFIFNILDEDLKHEIEESLLFALKEMMESNHEIKNLMERTK